MPKIRLLPDKKGFSPPPTVYRENEVAAADPCPAMPRVIKIGINVFV